MIFPLNASKSEECIGSTQCPRQSRWTWWWRGLLQLGLNPPSPVSHWCLPSLLHWPCFVCWPGFPRWPSFGCLVSFLWFLFFVLLLTSSRSSWGCNCRRFHCCSFHCFGFHQLQHHSCRCCRRVRCFCNSPSLSSLRRSLLLASPSSSMLYISSMLTNTSSSLPGLQSSSLSGL